MAAVGTFVSVSISGKGRLIGAKMSSAGRRPPPPIISLIPGSNPAGPAAHQRWMVAFQIAGDETEIDGLRWTVHASCICAYTGLQSNLCRSIYPV